jgi:hypothetical protein
LLDVTLCRLRSLAGSHRSFGVIGALGLICSDHKARHGTSISSYMVICLHYNIQGTHNSNTLKVDMDQPLPWHLSTIPSPHFASVSLPCRIINHVDHSHHTLFNSHSSLLISACFCTEISHLCLSSPVEIRSSSLSSSTDSIVVGSRFTQVQRDRVVYILIVVNILFVVNILIVINILIIVN